MLPRPAVDDDDVDIEEDLVPDGTDAIEVRLCNEDRDTTDELEHVDHVDEYSLSTDTLSHFQSPAWSVLSQLTPVDARTPCTVAVE